MGLQNSTPGCSHCVWILFSRRHLYYIKPLSNTTCTSAQFCITLSEFVQHNSTPTKNTTLMFLPGKHTLRTNISIANTNSYSLLGVLQNATIKCEENVGFTFFNILHIRIHHLVFTSCGIYRAVGIDDVIYDPPRVITQKFALFMAQYCRLTLPTPHLRTILGLR